MILHGEVLPERVISITERTSGTESKLDLLPMGRDYYQNPFQHLLSPEIQRTMDEYANYLNQEFNEKEKQLDETMEEVMLNISSASPGTPVNNLLEEIRAELRSKFNELKLQYRTEIDRLFNTLLFKIKNNASIWGRKLNTIKNYSNLNRKIIRITREFNDLSQRAGEEAVSEANVKLKDIHKIFEKDLLNYVLIKTSGKNLDEIIQELESSPEYVEQLRELRSRIVRSTAVTDPFQNGAFSYCNSGPWYRGLLAYLSTLGVGCLAVTIVVSAEVKMGVPITKAFEIGGRILVNAADIVFTIAKGPAKVIKYVIEFVADIGSYVITRYICKSSLGVYMGNKHPTTREERNRLSEATDGCVKVVEGINSALNMVLGVANPKLSDVYDFIVGDLKINSDFKDQILAPFIDKNLKR